MVTKKTPKVVLTAVAIVIAAYILSPFYLVLINTFKNANGCQPCKLCRCKLCTV